MFVSQHIAPQTHFHVINYLNSSHSLKNKPTFNVASSLFKKMETKDLTFSPCEEIKVKDIKANPLLTESPFSISCHIIKDLQPRGWKIIHFP